MKRTILCVTLMLLCTLLMISGVLAEEPIIGTEVETEIVETIDEVESEVEVEVEVELEIEVEDDETLLEEEEEVMPEEELVAEPEPEAEVEIEDEQIYAKLYSDKAGQIVERGELIVLKAIVDFEGDYTIRWESTPDGGKTVCVMGYGDEFSFRASDENVNWLWRAVVVVN